MVKLAHGNSGTWWYWYVILLVRGNTGPKMESVGVKFGDNRVSSQVWSSTEFCRPVKSPVRSPRLIHTPPGFRIFQMVSTYSMTL